MTSRSRRETERDAGGEMPAALRDELFGDPAARSEPGRRRWIWLVYATLFGLSVPWYLPATDTPAVWLGLPHWVVVSLGATLAAAVFTRFVVRRLWSTDASRPAAGARGRPLA